MLRHRHAQRQHRNRVLLHALQRWWGRGPFLNRMRIAFWLWRSIWTAACTMWTGKTSCPPAQTLNSLRAWTRSHTHLCILICKDGTQEVSHAGGGQRRITGLPGSTYSSTTTWVNQR